MIENILSFIFFLLFAVFIVLSVILAKDDILHFIFKKKKFNDQDIYYKIKDLSKEKINFFFNSSIESYKATWNTRDSENRNILAHTAIIVSTSSLFYLLTIFSYNHRSNFFYFLPLFVYLSLAFLSLIFSVICLLTAFKQPYDLPPKIIEAVDAAKDMKLDELKAAISSRLIEASEKNHFSNKEKMDLMIASRKYICYSLCLLSTAILFITIKEISFIICK